MILVEDSKKQNADIRIVGIGGAGCNALEVMIQEGIQGVQFIAINTDDQALEVSSSKTKIQIGTKLTKGLGAGASPEVGRRSAMESYEEIIKALKGADMLFITAGMGGGTGTGGAPLVAQAAKELGILTVAIVTTPFLFEGMKRMKQAQEGLSELKKSADTLISIPNEKLLQLSNKDIPLSETFKISDGILLQAVKGIAELVSVPGLINLDFADIKTVMTGKGMALMGRGLSQGADRAKKAALQAVSSPLLEGLSIEGATGMIVNITASSSLSLIEVQTASSFLTQSVDDSADVIIGTVLDENMGDQLAVTVIATGFPNTKRKEEQPPGKSEKTQVKDDPVKEIHFNEKASLKEDRPNPETKENLLPDPNQKLFESDKEFVFVGDGARESKPESLAHKEASSDKEFVFVGDGAKESKPESLAHKEASSDKEFVFVGDGAKESKPESLAHKEASFALSEEGQHFPSVSEKELKESNPSVSGQESKESNPSASSKDEEKKLSPKAKLLLKVKEYAQNQKDKEAFDEKDRQMSMTWNKDNKEEALFSPFESSIDFSEEDML